MSEPSRASKRNWELYHSRKPWLGAGNPGLCGGIPPGLTVLQKTGGGNTATTQYLNDKPCSVSADTMVQSAPAPQGGSSSNLGAIIGGVVGGIAALAALAAVVLFFVLRNRHRSTGSRGAMTPFGKAMPGDEKVGHLRTSSDI